MSNLVEKGKYPPDMSPKEVEDLESFIASGTPGLVLKKEQIDFALEMYINGASYRDISRRLGVKKYLILFYAHKHNFYEAKTALLESLSETMREKMAITNVKGMDLMFDVMAAIETYYRDILNQYMLTRDPRIIESTDFENFKMFMKCLESIQKSTDPNKGKSPGMGLNLPNGGILKKIDDNTVEVSPLNSQTGNTGKLGDVLKALAEFREKNESK